MKKVTVTIYDDFAAMAFFDVQYTNTGKSKLTIKSWTNNAYIVSAESGGMRRGAENVIVLEREIRSERDSGLIGRGAGPKLRVYGADPPDDEPRAERLPRVDLSRPVHPLDRYRSDLAAGFTCGK